MLTNPRFTPRFKNLTACVSCHWVSVADLLTTWTGDCLRTGKPSHYVASHPGQLSLAIPPWVGAMSTSESWDVDRHTARCTSPVSVVWQCKLVSGWGLRKRRSAPPYGPCGSGRTLRFLRFWVIDWLTDDCVMCYLLSWCCICHQWSSIHWTRLLRTGEYMPMFTPRWSLYTLCLKKRPTLSLSISFARYSPIFTILSLAHSVYSLQ